MRVNPLRIFHKRTEDSQLFQHAALKQLIDLKPQVKAILWCLSRDRVARSCFSMAFAEIRYNKIP
jgi:hypothetical protein